MGLMDWLQRLTGASRPSLDAEAALRNEVGGIDRGEADLNQVRNAPSYAAGEATGVAESDLSELERPRDPGV